MVGFGVPTYVTDGFVYLTLLYGALKDDICVLGRALRGVFYFRSLGVTETETVGGAL